MHGIEGQLQTLDRQRSTALPAETMAREIFQNVVQWDVSIGRSCILAGTKSIRLFFWVVRTAKYLHIYQSEKNDLRDCAQITKSSSTSNADIIVRTVWCVYYGTADGCCMLMRCLRMSYVQQGECQIVESGRWIQITRTCANPSGPLRRLIFFFLPFFLCTSVRLFNRITCTITRYWIELTKLH